MCQTEKTFKCVKHIQTCANSAQHSVSLLLLVSYLGLNIGSLECRTKPADVIGSLQEAKGLPLVFLNFMTFRCNILRLKLDFVHVTYHFLT